MRFLAIDEEGVSGWYKGAHDWYAIMIADRGFTAPAGAIGGGGSLASTSEPSKPSSAG